MDARKSVRALKKIKITESSESRAHDTPVEKGPKSLVHVNDKLEAHAPPTTKQMHELIYTNAHPVLLGLALILVEKPQRARLMSH